MLYLNSETRESAHLIRNVGERQGTSTFLEDENKVRRLLLQKDRLGTQCSALGRQDFVTNNRG